MSAAEAPLGVVLADLGGPASLDAVRPFVESLLADPAVLPLPGAARRLVAALAARLRESRAARRYAEVGGSSPLLAAIGPLVEAVGRELGPGFVVVHAFRHSPPAPRETLGRLREAGLRRVVALPLFPQRSATTTDSCLLALEDAARQERLELVPVGSFPEAEGLLDALAEGALAAAEGADHLLMTAHGLPRSHVRRGDPYVGEVERTAAALARRLPEGLPWSLAYQSRMGPVRWVGPLLDHEIARLAKAGVRRLALAPLSFACENLETRFDLDIEAVALARSLGIEAVRRAPAPGSHPAFAAELAHLVREAAESTPVRAGGR